MTTVLLATPLLSESAMNAEKYFKIQVVDSATGRGVPLVELQTVNNIRYFTDSNGVVAFHEPGLMDQTIFFHIKSHGYERKKDGFGYRGVRLKIKPGGSAKVPIDRINIAERLYRITGAGIYRDTVLLDEKAPLKNPVLNAKVFGSDSVVNALYKGKLYWFWGDTNQPAYPLGNFFVPGATSRLPKDGGLDADLGVDLEYFLDKTGFAKGTAKMPGPGPAWIDGVVVLPDPKTKKERLFAKYVRVQPNFKITERGLLEWNDEEKKFSPIKKFALDAPIVPGGHPFIHKDNDKKYVYFANPYPVVRVPANITDLTNLAAYEAYTCFVEGSREDKLKIDRDKQGRLRFAWRRNTGPLTVPLQNKLEKSGKLKAEEGLYQMRDADTGKRIQVHGGSISWNPYRQRWVMIALETYGSSFLGEIWYAEADTMLGPWRYARKVVTHDNYSFYNPKQHPYFAKDNGRHIYFEGTYTHTFTNNKDQTPRYDYNQIMYKLDLHDPRLYLPCAVYFENDNYVLMKPKDAAAPEFFALDRFEKGLIPIIAKKTPKGTRLVLGNADAKEVAFYALATETPDAPKTTTPLYEWISPTGDVRYSVAENRGEGWRRGKTLCQVWRPVGP